MAATQCLTRAQTVATNQSKTGQGFHFHTPPLINLVILGIVVRFVSFCSFSFWLFLSFPSLLFSSFPFGLLSSSRPLVVFSSLVVPY